MKAPQRIFWGNFWPKSSNFEVKSSQVAIFRYWLESFWFITLACSQIWLGPLCKRSPAHLPQKIEIIIIIINPWSLVGPSNWQFFPNIKKFNQIYTRKSFSKNFPILLLLKKIEDKISWSKKKSGCHKVNSKGGPNLAIPAMQFSKPKWAIRGGAMAFKEFTWFFLALVNWFHVLLFMPGGWGPSWMDDSVKVCGHQAPCAPRQNRSPHKGPIYSLFFHYPPPKKKQKKSWKLQHFWK